MADFFEIPVTHKGQEITLKARSVRFGYINHILVDVNGTEVTIERDEEGKFRVLGDPEKMNGNKVSQELVKSVVAVLESL